VYIKVLESGIRRLKQSTIFLMIGMRMRGKVIDEIGKNPGAPVGSEEKSLEPKLCIK
jgi:hypothetical protein